MLEVARLAIQTDLTRIVTLYYVGTSKTPSKPGTSFAHARAEDAHGVVEQP